MYPTPENCGKKTVMLLFCAVLFSIRFTQAQCIASGPNNPTSSANVPYSGSDYDFDDYGNVQDNDNNLATAASLASIFPKTTDYLQAKGFGFNIPTAATICGIEAHVTKSADDIGILFISAYVKDYDVRLLKTTTTPIGTDQSDPSAWNSSLTTTNYGGVNELWGTSWSPADINSNNFGFSIAAEIITGVGLLPVVNVDNISMTVYYLDPSVLSAQAIQFNVVNASNNTAMLSWKQGSFDETTSYVVERSANGFKWETINGSPQNNTSSSLYTFRDTKPLPGKSFYRLKMIAAEGNTHYTTSQPFELIDHTTLTCYPNPFTSVIQVKGVMAGERVTVTNMYGQCIYSSAPAVTNTLTVNINDLQPGMYVISAGNRKMKVAKR